MSALTDEQLKAKTAEFKEWLSKGETLDDILSEAFAVCREADWRVLGMKPFPIQIIGGIALHRCCIAEMQTGEGKTLVATLPVYLNLAISNQYKAFNFLRFLDFRAPRHHAPEAAHVIHHS